jgi:hypothetical protein
METKIMKTAMVIGIIGLFFGLAAMPGMCVKTTDDEEIYRLRIIISRIGDEEKDGEMIVKEITASDKDDMMAALEPKSNQLRDYIVDYITAKKRDNPTGAIEEKIELLTDGIAEYFLNTFPELNTNENDLKETLKKLLIIGTILGLYGVVSYGMGFSWIPTFGQELTPETFAGVMLRPIYMFHFKGTTGVGNIKVFPPRIEYANKAGPHIVKVRGFVGIYADIGKLTKGKAQGMMPFTFLVGGSTRSPTF